MLQLYNKNKVKIKGLKSYKDYKIESVLSTGDKKLSFLYPIKLGKEIEEEGYIRTKTEEFVIKEIKDNNDWKSIVATMNVESLEGQAWEHFDTTEQTIGQCLTLAVAGTGWTVQVNGSTKKRTVRITNCSSWEIIQQAKKTYRVEISFDTLNKIIKIYEIMGSDKGAYFIDSLNLKALEVQSSSYDYYTRMIAIGKDDLKVTVENYQYSSKKKTLIWKDERYTDINSLRDDATLKLNEISKPYRAYSADVIDLANSSDKYRTILGYGLGDTITLIDSDKGIKEKQRIAKIIEYPEEPERNTCEISNILLSFIDMQKEQADTTDTVNNITSDNGTISESAISENTIRVAVKHLTIDKLDVNSLNAVEIRVGTLEATTATITQLTAINAKIVNLEAVSAKVTDLTATNAKIDVLEATTGNINTLLAGNLTSSNIQSGGINSDRLTIENGFITNLMVASLDVGKVNAGDISTNKFRIISTSGNMLIADNTIQIKDANRVRVQIGKDDSNDYNMYVWDSSGQLMFDATGLKADGIKSKIIRNDMVSETANISGSKLDISSVVTSINGGTTYIKGSKVQLDGVAQTLDIVFANLKTKADGTDTKTESNTTAISVQQGQINIAIANAQIIKDGKTILLKDDYNTTVATVNSINTTIGKHQSTLDAYTGQITGVTTQVTEVKKSLDGITTRVSSSETKITTLNTNVSNANSEINQLKGKIELKVEQTQVDTSINNLKIGGRNLVLNSNFKGIPQTSSCYGFAISNDMALVAGKQYVLSFNGHVDAQAITDGKELRVFVNEDTWVSTINISTNSLTSKTVSGIFNCTKTAIHRLSAYLYSNGGSRVGKATVNWYKFEEGNKATDWTPAPEDIQGQIDTATTRISTAESTLSLIPGQFALVAKKTDLTTINNNVTGITTRMKTAESSITAQAGQISLKASQTSLNTTNNNVNGITNRVSTAEASLNIHASQISQKVSTSDFGTLITQNTSSVKIAVGEIGGNNLFHDGGFLLDYNINHLTKSDNNMGFEIESSRFGALPRHGNKIITYSVQHSTISDLYLVFHQQIPVLAGKSYVIQYDAASGSTTPNSGPNNYVYWKNAADANVKLEQFGVANDDNQVFNHHSVTVVAPAGATYMLIRFGQVYPVGNTSMWFTLSSIKIEEGSNETAWSPNSDELKTSSFEVNKDHARFTGQDGSYTEFCPGQTGLKWHQNTADGVGKDYHYLLYKGSVSFVESQSTVRITLPDIFRGKNYLVSWQTGNVFPRNEGDLLYSANAELTQENKNGGWFEVKAAMMCRNPNTEGTPSWKGKMNIIYSVVA